MADIAHSALPNAELHEPKGVASATDGDVYIANGSGSGSWGPIVENIASGSLTDELEITGLDPYVIVGLSFTAWYDNDGGDNEFGIRLGSNGSYLSSSSGYKSTFWDYTANDLLPADGSTDSTSIWAGYTPTNGAPSADNFTSMVIYNFNKVTLKTAKVDVYTDNGTYHGLVLCRTLAVCDSVQVHYTGSTFGLNNLPGTYQVWGIRG